ncbi:MAG: bifunctional glutamate N-acetyltransferase/amino-acid acetyltransferase ArgJ [Deltaproteobacteria bacterium]|nr:bifunctional glutamate N-acetyltransferase/amino-acid acetyltransferase ArgJ [Deltaproteobacteria bacterium]MDQ3299470.1 bifunctional glutamate N-acetyltransferase/amino-acid acetyltransferase ArgJ [Myxococcota bacterium]
MKWPPGFRFAGVACGIKPHRPDLALVVSDVDAACAGAFTVNRAKAAPVVDAEHRLPAEGMRAIVINSGNANALTGSEGLQAVSEVLAATAAGLGVAAAQVLSASTGVIGMKLPAHKIVVALPKCIEGLSGEPDRAAEAIMTTDTTRKLASRSITVGGKDVTVAALCKGSGMIAPQLATTIALIVTDCAITAEVLDDALEAATRQTFDQLTIDGDMSTNDSVFVLANGLAGNRCIDSHDEDYATLAACLVDLLDELAQAIAADGEGATKRILTLVTGAPSEDIARDIAKSITGSPLVKAAMFGGDPNWGRVLSTVGSRAGSQGYDIDPANAEVTIQNIVVYDGAPQPFDRAALRAKLREPEVVIDVELRSGELSARAYGCDLSYDYVKLNADYTSLLVEAPGGGIAKDDRLGNYSPAFKRALLVEALSYISRFRGKRCVIKYGGAAMVRDSLKRSFCDDVLLLHSVGLAPIVVHGGGPELAKAFEKYGARELVDGMFPVTSADELLVVERVTDQINAELVSQLNRRGPHAVGLSGKDAGLLRAKKLVRGDGRDLGQVGELVAVNHVFLESLVSQGYIPVLSPIGIGPDGETYDLDSDAVAAEVARGVKADKLIYLSNVAGVMDAGDLVSELTASELRTKLEAGVMTGGMALKAAAILHALGGGVRAVHLIDGRAPHTMVAELFTDTGVGTIIRPDA